MARFYEGQRVRSKPCGTRDAFDGIVVKVREETLTSGQVSFPMSYDVRDDAGAEWNRGHHELSLI